ncbi:MAG: c-type cytochrome [Pseudomonadota bacterium]|jgi:cytochrome c
MRLVISMVFAAVLGVSLGAAKAEEASALSDAGDPDRGQRLYNQCRACHNLTNDKAHKRGPNLAGLFGRPAGKAADYALYSAALRDADFTWSEAALDRWLADPRGFLPGNKMSFAGLRKEEDRRDLIAYLRRVLDEMDGK